MDCANGKTKEISRRCNYCGAEIESERMGGVTEESSSDGTNKISVSREDRHGGNPDWKLVPVRDTTAGKILERLEALEKRHLEYVHSHQARLKARLGESEQSENEFKEECNQIKSDIYHLVTQSKSVDIQ
ncbi:hypothetical protein I8748_22890 [Nostoc sp. CENA67]|uniref:Uncharacterized protein n=1 Tax=Amazonocrinis nigriterrae CENA67 TaxID=2794033 RepID=A0A8J7L8Z8_9NOST|nr:hypothetical protein [Amazonocrinis nigriterrae]MBH8564994.1 hypothetical protein [Amazonocrinis nigriterrae CENA67]